MGCSWHISCLHITGLHDFVLIVSNYIYHINCRNWLLYPHSSCVCHPAPRKLTRGSTQAIIVRVFRCARDQQLNVGWNKCLTHNVSFNWVPNFYVHFLRMLPRTRVQYSIIFSLNSLFSRPTSMEPHTNCYINAYCRLKNNTYIYISIEKYILFNICILFIPIFVDTKHYANSKLTA